MVKDPVCGMMIDPNQAVASVSFRGRQYHFCSATCKAKFDANPQKYAVPLAVLAVEDGG